MLKRSKIFIAFFFAFFFVSTFLQACDSSMLEILTGTKTQDSVTARILYVSQKMQETGSFLKAFNNAAARKNHLEVMQMWLYIASVLSGDYCASAEEYSAFSHHMVKISKSLGQIRRQLDKDDLTLIHETLELAITRMSLVSAIINKKEKIKKFIELEMCLYLIRPRFNELKTLKKLFAKSDFSGKLASIKPGLLSNSGQMLSELEELNDSFLASLTQDTNKLSVSTKKCFQKLLNKFVLFKQNLLNNNYFNKL